MLPVDESIFLLIFLNTMIIVMIWLAHQVNDHARIRRYIRTRDGEVLSIHPPAGFMIRGDVRSRIYLVEYLDCDGNKHQARCNTARRIGVVLCEDHIIEYPSPPTDEGGTWDR